MTDLVVVGQEMRVRVPSFHTAGELGRTERRRVVPFGAAPAEGTALKGR